MTSLEKSPLFPSRRTTPDATSAEFAKLLRQRRESAGLSRRRLAELAGLSEATIKLVELCKTRPSRRTLLQLLLLPGLGLLSSDLPLPRRELPKELFSSQNTPANCYLAPDHEPIRYLEELEHTLRGAGGQLEQSCLYLSPQSALLYQRYLRSSPREQRRRTQLPLDEIVSGLPSLQTTSGLTVIVLGSGDGQLEARLVHKLLSLCSQPVSLWLVDLSCALLATAFRNVGSMLGQTIQHRLGVLADFLHLPRYTELFSSALDRGQQRLYVLLGTLGHLDHELGFLRDVLGHVARGGDLLLLDAELLTTSEVGRAQTGSPSQAEEAALRNWLCEPLSQATPRPHHITLEETIDAGGLVPGSIARNLIATIESRGQLPRQFSVLRQRRYQLASLHALMEQSGFVPRGTALWHDPPHGTTALLLGQRKSG